jgi:hypothetical protein
MTKFLISLLSSIVLAVYIKTAWLWFIVPLGVQPLTGYAHAFGLSALLTVLTNSPQTEDTRSVDSKLFDGLLLPTAAFLCSAIYYQLM